jgi:hypothetical protein
MIELSSYTHQEEIKPLQTRMKASWTDATKEEQKMYIEKMYIEKMYMWFRWGHKGLKKALSISSA